MKVHPALSPLVSVIIPTRNRVNDVVRAVASVCAQSYRALEIIVVIDGSDPVTQATLAAIDDTRLRVVALAESVGGSDARNTGVQHANGTWVAFLDDDDEWLPTKIEKQVQAVQAADTTDVLVVCRFFLKRSEQNVFIRPARVPRPGEALSEYMFKGGCGFQTSSFFCSRELALKIPFTSGLRKHQDWDWFLRLTSAPQVKLCALEEPLAVWYDLPKENRTSSNSDWQFSLGWLRANVELFTPRAFSVFIARVCLRSAVAQGIDGTTLWTLARAMIYEGSLSLPAIFYFVVIGFVPRRTITAMRHFFLRHSRDHKASVCVPESK